MKAWLKGGLIGGLILLGIDFLFWLYFIVRVATCIGDMCGLAGGAVIVYGLPSLIPAFIIGAIIGAISGKIFDIERKIITKSSKIGFIIGLIISISIFVFGAWGKYISHKANIAITHLPPLKEYFQLPLLLYLILIAIPFISAWVIWVINGLIRK